MAKLRVKYIPIDPFYSTIEQVFIGNTVEECEDQEYEYEKWLGHHHPCGITYIYKTEIVSIEY